MIARRFALLPLVSAPLLALVGAACGGGSDSSPGSATIETREGDATATPAGPTAIPAAEIDQQDLTFLPATVTVKVGDTVLIKNSETPIHTANINGKNITGNMKRGDTVPWVAPAAGEYQVTCDYHPLMKATIVVRS
jgi:plastocyanin